jgi:hypothetical protein
MENIINLLEEKAAIINEKFDNEPLNENQAEIVRLLLDVLDVIKNTPSNVSLFPKSKINSLGMIDDESLNSFLNKYCEDILKEIAIKKLGYEAKSQLILFKAKNTTREHLKQTIKILFSSDLDKLNILDLHIFKKISLIKSEVQNGK